MVTSYLDFPNHAPLPRVERLTRNHLEFAGVIVYLFILAIAFTLAFIAMVFETGTVRYAGGMRNAPTIAISSNSGSSTAQS